MMLTHNTARSGGGNVPVVLENVTAETAELFPVGDGHGEWHETTNEEYATYLAYWDSIEED